VAAEPPVMERIAARLMTRVRAERAGFEFVTAQLRGDRQLRLRVLTGLILPTLLTVATWLRGRLNDPFAAPPGTPADPLVISVGYFTLFFLTSGMLTLRFSPQWKAGYIFYVAPVRNFDAIQRGAYSALVYAMYAPAILLQVACLTIAWRNPMHVALGLGPPLAALPLSAAITLLYRSRPPFSISPAGMSRAGSYAEASMLLAPMVVLYALHLHMLSSPARLGLLSLCCGSAGLCMLWLLQRRRDPVPSHAFEG